MPLLPDKAPANGSTIAVLAEYGEGNDRKSCLLTGDAHPDVFEEGLKRLCKDRRVDRIAVNALKVPHHGSRFNVSKGALDLIETERYLFSTNGTQTDHPHLEGVARTIARGGEPTLYFNYRSEFTEPWDDRRLQRRSGFKHAGLSGRGDERPHGRSLTHQPSSDHCRDRHAARVGTGPPTPRS